MNGRDATVTFRRREPGSYLGEIEGVRVALVNMKGSGPNAPIWRGPVPAWQIRLGGQGDYDVGCRVAQTVWTLAEAKAWVAENVACPKRAKHTPCPDGYVAWHEWAEKKAKTHKQERCPTCGLWAIWKRLP